MMLQLPVEDSYRCDRSCTSMLPRVDSLSCISKVEFDALIGSNLTTLCAAVKVCRDVCVCVCEAGH